ncbi:unnamed protein product [Lepeophtheirus salmonis]|uniref:(salmon louse) hypothetical protein n=1 Tax=Lepeophtheirus salmonis TaxID=72036 RepID=A0A7R8D568_LEPSM|nr:unnamed protein product [Lepeophtheirus salmonis]CAF3002059.1 unnamed protein product [Lepeophtheirus salmonis]
MNKVMKVKKREKNSTIPILDEFAQFLNASIHPPNELSVPRCYPEQPGISQTAPGSRRSSTSSRGAALGIPYRNTRSLSLGYSQQPPGTGGQSGGGPRNQSFAHSNSNKNACNFSRGMSLGGALPTNNSGRLSPTNRPVLRRESAQDCGDEETGSRLHPALPDLKIDLPPGESGNPSFGNKSGTTNPANGPSTPTSNTNPSNPYIRSTTGTTLSPNPDSNMNVNPLYQRRHSNCMRGTTRQMTRNKSAPATPLNRIVELVEALSPESRNDDLYCLRQFTVSNKRVVNRGDSLQPRYCRSNSSICSSGSSLSYSHSGRSSLRSSTEDDDAALSRDGSIGGPGRSSRFTVLMLGAGDVGKTLLTSQFMSSNDVGAYGNDSQEEEYGEKCVSVLLEGEESELVFIDRPYAEMSVENAVSTYVPDAMIVVFSVVNKDSLQTAESILEYLWRSGSNTDKAVIMVGNKSDLVRSRVVSIVDAKSKATSYDCKYTETSATLNHNVDELLVGTLTQIRLKLAERQRFMRKGRKSAGMPVSHMSTNSTLTVQSSSANIRRKSAGTRVKGILDKVLKGESKSKSCDDLHVL